ncbi:MAG TPA: deoxyhypusine synthase, partial [Ktedonobacter sp.]|nr:deoxyhypusine synthase [Ktedonobacter sp.]
MPHRPDHHHEQHGHHNHNEEQEEQHVTQSEYLSGPQILPHRVRPNMTVAELIDEQFQAYNAARLSEAAHLYAEEMLLPERDTTVGMTMAGALTPAGLGGCVLTLIEYGFVDF